MKHYGLPEIVPLGFFARLRKFSFLRWLDGQTPYEQIFELSNGGTKTVRHTGFVMYRDKEGRRHRLGGPAEKAPNGSEVWWVNGERHRTGGGPAITDHTGRKVWMQHDELFREDGGPTVEGPGLRKTWSARDYRGRMEYHRLDGPAVIDESGDPSWWIFGITALPESTEACIEACDPNTSEDRLFELVYHDDPVVAALAAHNPNAGEYVNVVYALTPKSEWILSVWGEEDF